MKSIRYLILFLSAVLLSLTACNTQTATENAITVTIEPQRYFAEKIAKGKFVIHTMVPPGQNPENYEPTPSQMITIGKSKAYLKIGYLGFEKAWMNNIQQNNPQLKIFDLSKGMSLITGKEHIHEHNGEKEIHQNETDPHIWNSTQGARVIASNILKAFISLDKENETFYQQNYEQLIKEIDQTEKEVKKLLSTLNSRTFIIYHPALTYFANENNLEQLCIEMDGKDPSPAQLKTLIDTAKEHHTKIVFVQKEFDSRNASLISQETDCKLISINPLSYNWKEGMIQIAKALNNGENN